MEPQIIDHYNELPHSINVIDKMNEELSEAQKETKKLKEELEKYKMMNLYVPKINITLINKEQYIDYMELFDEIKENIRNHLYIYKENGLISDEEYDLKKACENSYKLVEILFNGLNDRGANLNISREWCEYRIDNALDKFKSLVKLQNYWWENMIKDSICNDIIEMIIEEIIDGNDYEIKLYECLRIKCDKCNHVFTIEGGDIIDEKKWICWDCLECSES